MTTELKQVLTDKHLISFLLPKFFNNGQRIPKKLFEQTYNEILDLFGGYSLGGTIKGVWKNNGIVYKDQNILVNVIIDNFDELILSTLVNTLKERFNQLEIYTTLQQIKKLYITN